MTLTIRTIDRVAVLDLVGRLTSTDGSGLLKAAVDRLIAEQKTDILLNLSQLSYIDSSGLGEMIACYTTASKAGGAVKLAHLTAKIQDLLSITKLITVFDTFDTEQLALESFAVPVGVRSTAAIPTA
jgi:anti-sigma B factor antagonist